VAEAELVQLAFAQMPRNYRDCLLLRIEGQLSLCEIAGLLEISEASARTYVCTARRLFREAHQNLIHEFNAVEIRRTVL
jgi:DNA-directed RNA polymerase specialized sigma24 family protein